MEPPISLYLSLRLWVINGAGKSTSWFDDDPIQTSNYRPFEVVMKRALLETISSGFPP
jgi:hypothetical protein